MREVWESGVVGGAGAACGTGGRVRLGRPCVSSTPPSPNQETPDCWGRLAGVQGIPPFPA